MEEDEGQSRQLAATTTPPRGPHGFDGLLALLSSDREQAAERYRQIHSRIVQLYEWRGCGSPEELADETFDRVASKIESGVEIDQPERYILRVAGLVFKEIVRREIRQRKAIESGAVLVPFQPERVELPGTDVEREIEEKRRVCFQGCLQGLDEYQRQSLLRYYTGEKQQKIIARQRLAQDLGLASGALRIRMYRLRRNLERCVSSCVERPALTPDGRV